MTNEGDDFSSNYSSNNASDDDMEVTNAPPTNISSMPGNEAPSRSEPTQRSTKTRGVTLLTKIRNSTDCTIQFCPDTGRAIGAYSSKYANWVGLEARSKISILVSDWHKVDADEKARLWAAIKQKWNIEEDDKLKKKTMSIASNSRRSFKSKLVKSYVRKNKTPYSKYGFIKPNTWDEFVKLKLTPEFETLSQKNSEHAKLNDNPHHLGSRGYLGKQDSWATYKDRGIMPEIQNMYSKRARDFILARLVKSGPDEFILPDNMKPIVEDMIEKDKQFSQGDRDPEVAVDPLAAVLGPEHPGRTRGVGHNVGLRVGLGLGNKRRRPNKKDAEIKELRERISNLEQQVKELKAERLSKNNASPAGSPIVKSSVGSTALDPRIESILEATNCDLVFRCGGAKILVAKGLAYPLSTDVLHGNPLEEGFMKVQVDMVMDGCEEYDLPVPMPNADIEKLGQAIGNFIQWEIRSVVLRQPLPINR